MFGNKTENEGFFLLKMAHVLFPLRFWCPREEQEDGRRFLPVFSATGDPQGEEQDAQTSEYPTFSSILRD